MWLFTDRARLPDPLAAAARLPPGKAGVVLRDDAFSGRADLGSRLARLCRARRLVLLVAGDARLAAALGAGVHLRAGRWPGSSRRRGFLVSSSVHDLAEMRRAERAGARLLFLSPFAQTASHPGARALGPCRWVALARQGRSLVLALGGVSGRNAGALPARFCAGVAAIGALE
ncbi:MAG: thiamine phosphate synthase [Acetobacteraceae bacterium]